MKNRWILVVMFLMMALESQATWIPGHKPNHMLTCVTENGSNQVLIFSDKYTTMGYGELTEDPGTIYSLVGYVERSRDNKYTVRSVGKLMPFKQIDQTGFFDKVLGIYENEQFRLDLRSRSEEEIKLEKLSDGTKLVCYVEGDCC